MDFAAEDFIRLQHSLRGQDTSPTSFAPTRLIDVMEGYSTRLDWHGGPDHGWWVSCSRIGERVAYMSLDEWKSLGATRQRMETTVKNILRRAA
jgi:hypothetical protein